MFKMIGLAAVVFVVGIFASVWGLGWYAFGQDKYTANTTIAALILGFLMGTLAYVVHGMLDWINDAVAGATLSRNNTKSMKELSTLARTQGVMTRSMAQQMMAQGQAGNVPVNRLGKGGLDFDENVFANGPMGEDEL